MLPHEELTHRVIGAAIAVHRALGPGFLESIYENALVLELEVSGMRVERQRIVPVLYRERQVGEHRVDLLLVLIELKAVSELQPIFFATVRSYLKALHLEAALLLNFATTPLTVKRAGREVAEFGKQENRKGPPVHRAFSL